MMKAIELRNYLLGPGRTRDFIRYFEEHFLFSQRDHGMHPLGQFEVVGEPDRFVWIRGFDDMRTRLRGLSAFYSGPFWQARRAEANAMMLEHHNVHLLRPLGSIAALTGGATLEDRASEPPGAVPPETGLVVADFYRTEPAKLGASSSSSSSACSRPSSSKGTTSSGTSSRSSGPTTIRGSRSSRTPPSSSSSPPTAIASAAPPCDPTGAAAAARSHREACNRF